MIISKSMRFLMSMTCILACTTHSTSCLATNLWMTSNSSDTHATGISYVTNGPHAVNVMSTGITLFADADCKTLRSEFTWNKAAFLMQPATIYQLNPKELYLNDIGKNCSAIGKVCYMEIELTSTNDQQSNWSCVPMTCNSVTKSCDRLNNGEPYPIKLPKS